MPVQLKEGHTPETKDLGITQDERKISLLRSDSISTGTTASDYSNLDFIHYYNPDYNCQTQTTQIRILPDSEAYESW